MSVEALQVMDFCGRGRIIDQGPDHWWVGCTQSRNHSGPHVGLIAWDEDEATFDYGPEVLDSWCELHGPPCSGLHAEGDEPRKFNVEEKSK